MIDIQVKKGLDIPILGIPKILKKGGNSPKKISLSLKSFTNIRFKLLLNIGDIVKIGSPIAEDKSCPKRKFVSPASGRVDDIIRGEKRKILEVVIQIEGEETFLSFSPLNKTYSKSDLIDRLLEGGGFTHIHRRPFGILAKPEETPKAIFVKAIEPAFTASPALQVKDNEELFQSGLTALKKLTSGEVHLVYSFNEACEAFVHAKEVSKHLAKGPSPIENPSTHIYHIARIRSKEDIIWTLNIYDVICIGSLVAKGEYFIKRILSFGGPSTKEEERGFFPSRLGCPVSYFKEKAENAYYISGSLLTGENIGYNSYLGFRDLSIIELPLNNRRQPLHFFRLGMNKFTASKTYFSGLLKIFKKRPYSFSANQNGEFRAFVDGSIYDKYTPLNIPVMELIKAILAEDYDLAEKLGFLEVVGEDFAVPSFICPSKIEMIDIVNRGIQNYIQEIET